MIFFSPVVSDEVPDKRERILEYFEYVGLFTGLELTVESTYADSVKFYSYLPDDFWEDERVINVFRKYKEDLIRLYVDAMEEGVTLEEVEFLIDFYQSEKGKKVVELGIRTEGLFVDATSEANQSFTAVFSDLIEEYAH